MITPFYFIIRECGKILRREVKILQKKIEEYVNAYYLTFYLSDHLLKYEWNFTGGGGHSLLWLEATTFLNYIDIYLSDHLLKYGRNFAGRGGNNLLWPEATACLNHLGAYSWPEVDIVMYGPMPHGDKRRTLLIEDYRHRHSLA